MVSTWIHYKRVSAEEIGPSASADLSVWLFFQIAADHILLPILVATFLLSRSIARHPTVINVCCTWIIAGIISSLLFYVGEHVGPEPSKGLCIAQSGLIAAVPPMTSVAVLALVYHTWASFNPSRVESRRKLSKYSPLVIALLSAPYIVFAIFAGIGIGLGTQHPEMVNRARRSSTAPSTRIPCNDNTMAIFTALVCIAATILELRLVVMLSRNWRALRRAGYDSGIDIQLAIRVGIFTLYILTATIVFPDMFAASVGMAFFLVFASQSDVLRVWRFWRQSPPKPKQTPRSSLSRTLTPQPSFSLDLFKRTDSELSEQARLEALHAYYAARVHEMGVEVEVIKRPEDAFVVGREPRRAGRRRKCGHRMGAIDTLDSSRH
ncbi:hypothetical protein A0H81_08424 [Grifola frondosa]|uniref:Uncharacterized protein n=1 Tax=Grifola frondosa TaxID=5627 RepID=A0A1C7M3M8_GRIFR|nr:hypothetical protein A0H81_08424 [Grifola frondosa]